MKRHLTLVLAVVLTLVTFGWVPLTASAAPLPATYTASAGGDVAAVDLNLLTGIDLASVNLAHSTATTDSAATPPVRASSSNLGAAVVGLGVGVASKTSTAPLDSGPTADTLVGFNLLGIGLGALTTNTEAHYTAAPRCTSGLLARASTTTDFVTVKPIGLLPLAETGLSSTTTRTDLVSTGGNGLNRKVVSTSSGAIDGISVLDGAVTVGIAGNSSLTATATGQTGGSSVAYAPGTVTVKVGTAAATVLATGSARTIDVAAGQVIVTANNPTKTEAANGRSATASVSVVTLQIRLGGATLPAATATVKLLPLTVNATAPAGGIDCPPAAPAISAPAEGSSTGNTKPTISGTGEPGSTINLTINGTVVTGAATVTSGGTWSYTPTTALATGAVSVTATQTLNGATSAASATTHFNILATPTLNLSASASSLSYGSSVTLTATLSPTAATGVVEFFAKPQSGPRIGETLSLGSATAVNGTATLTATPGEFGANLIVATYGGNSTYAQVSSNQLTLNVNGYAGQVLISELRASGPAGSGDSYLELYNTGQPVSLAGFRIESSSGAVIKIPASAPLLGTRRSYLIGGPNFSLGSLATPDLTANLGTGGWRVLAPDTALTQTDAAGPTSGYHLGTGLAAVTGTPTGQHAFVRAQKNGRPVNTSDNQTDFALVSTTGGVIGGAQSMLGAPSPTGFGDPYQENVVLTSALLDSGVATAVSPNRVYSAGSPGRLIIMRTVTNTSAATITSAKARITALSEVNGLPKPDGAQPVNVAKLRAVTPWGGPTSSVSTLARGRVLVNNLTPDAPNTATPGGGLNTTLTIPLPQGGLPPGGTVEIAFCFEVDAPGTFWFGYDVDARGSTAALRAAATKNKTTIKAQRQLVETKVAKKIKKQVVVKEFASGQL